jgi:hypothetical protein
MTAIYLLILATAMLSTLAPAPLDVDHYAAYSAPIYAQMTGQPAHDVSIYWHMDGPYSYVPVSAGGCYRSVYLYAPYRGRPETWWHLAHELGHTYQGAACLSIEPYRDGGRLMRRQTRAIVGVEQTAQLMALESLATACRRGYPGACYGFWHGIRVLAELSTQGGELQALYYAGVIERMAPVVDGVALHGGRLVLDDAWWLLSGQVMERVR